MNAGRLQSAYGMTVSGLPLLPELVPGPAAGPVAVQISIVSDAVRTPEPSPLDAERGVRRLADGRLLALDRLAGTAVFYGPSLSPDLLAHPYLGPVATAYGRWAGREAFHAGAFVTAGRAWAVLGPRTAGKSTLMAALSAYGMPVLSDDITITDGAVAYRGPRCIDLREVPPGLDLEPRLARRDTRHRVYLPAGPDEVPLGGWIFLAWGDDLAAQPRDAPALLRDLAARRAWRHLASDPTLLLSLATLPSWTLTRPRRWAGLGATIELLEQTLAAAAATHPEPLQRGAQA